jgi:thiol-disulfide isomerase/thioredoxin
MRISVCFVSAMLAIGLTSLSGCGVDYTDDAFEANEQGMDQKAEEKAEEKNESKSDDSQLNDHSIASDTAIGKKETEKGGDVENSSVSIEKIDINKFNEWLVEQKGNVVLVDYWATWCTPCIKKFPKVVSLHGALSGKGLVVCSVCLDEIKADDTEKMDLVKNHLQRFGARFDNFVVVGSGIESFEDFDLQALPTCRVFDANGKLLKEFEGEFEFDEVEMLIHQQLK